MTTIKEDLLKLDKQRLVDFIDGLYGVEKGIDQRIDRLLVIGDAKKLAALFKKSIASLNRRKAFVRYSESVELGVEIEQLSLGIFDELLPLSAQLAADLLEKLLATGVNSLERCDDSGGSVGMAYQDIVPMWLRAAKAVGKTDEHWIKKIKALKESDLYAIFDTLLPSASLLLSNDGLRELAFYYETKQRNETDEWQAFAAYVNASAMAKALEDTEMYERCLLYSSPEPNRLQLEPLILFCLQCGDEGRAIKWLEYPENPEPSWLAFKIRSYHALEHTVKLPSLCSQLLECEPSVENLQLCIEMCPSQAEDWQAMALSLLPTLDAVGQIDLLLTLQMNDEALTSAMQNYAVLRQGFYTDLLYLLANVPAEYPLLRAIIYRCLLLDLLERGYSKAYRHGANYLQSLRALDKQIFDYHILESHDELEAHLKDKHGRKTSFWAML